MKTKLFSLALLLCHHTFATVGGDPSCDRASLPNGVEALPMYPEIDRVETLPNGDIAVYVTSDWPSNRNPIIQKQNGLNVKVIHGMYYYRAVIDSIEQVPNCYPILHAKVDSAFLGPIDHINRRFKIEPNGSRPVDKYPENYWSRYKNIKFKKSLVR